MMPIRFVVGTREKTIDDFSKNTLTGQSLQLQRAEPVEVRVFLSNFQGLPEIYNVAIREAEADPATLVFVHDDVLLTDFFWAERIREGLRHFDVIGVAGNVRRLAGQPAWFLRDLQFNWDSAECLSGVVGTGESFPPTYFSYFGKPGVEAALLDGFLLAAESETLHRHSLRFDERFSFDFYDLDFSREASGRGLKLGTWPISVVHRSGGNFGTERWHQAFATYLAKWGD